MTTRRIRRAIVERQGRPAHENAPARLRASQIERPFVPELERTSPAGDIFERLFGSLLERVGR